MDEILEYVLEKALPVGLTFKSERKNDSLYLPEIDTVITPIIAQVHETNVGIEFYVNVRKYDRILYEWCTGWGNDVFLSFLLSKTKKRLFQVHMMVLMDGKDLRK